MSSLKTRVIINHCVNYQGVSYQNEELYGRNGERVLVEESVNVWTAERILVVYDEDETEICEMTLGNVQMIGELNETM